MIRTTAANALIRRSLDGKYLVLRGSDWPERPDRSHQPDFPGGVVEPGEAIETGCLREVLEETGISAGVNQLSLVYGHSSVFKQANEAITRLIYILEVEGDPAVTLSWEHEAYEWLTKDELSDLSIREPYPSIVRYLQETDALI